MQDTLHQWFDHLVSLLPIVPNEAWVAVLVLPIALALFSSRPVIVLGSVMAAAMSFFVVLQPHLVHLIFAAAAYVGGILVAIYGIQTKRADSATRAKIIDLESKVASLQSAEERRLFAELRRDNNDPENLMIPWQQTNSLHRHTIKNARNGLSKPESPAAIESKKPSPEPAPAE
jgi:hypothetical protein